MLPPGIPSMIINYPLPTYDEMVRTEAEWIIACTDAQHWADKTGDPHYVVSSKNYAGYNVIPARAVEDAGICEINKWTPLRVFSRKPL